MAAALAPDLNRLITRFELPAGAPAAARRLLPAFSRKAFGPTLVKFFRLAELFRRRSDVEEIHDLRVMARRLSEYLEILGPVAPAALVMAGQDYLQRLMRSLSPVRNADVSRGLLQEAARRDLSALEKEALLFLDRALSKRREGRLGPALDLARREDSQERLAQLAQLRRALGRAGNAQKDAFAAAFPAHFRRRGEEARGHFEKEAALSSDKDLHGLRIGLRRLRYCGEMARSMGGRLRKGDIARIRRFQQILGEHHDLAVLLGRIAKEAGRLKQGDPGAEALKKGFARLTARYARRRDVHVRAFHRLAGTETRAPRPQPRPSPTGRGMKGEGEAEGP